MTLLILVPLFALLQPHCRLFLNLLTLDLTPPVPKLVITLDPAPVLILPLILIL